MLGTALKLLNLKVLQNPIAAISAFTRDPLEAWMKFSDYVDLDVEQRKPACRYEAESDWEHHLHDFLGHGRARRVRS
jgi:hypothetical protein